MHLCPLSKFWGEALFSYTDDLPRYFLVLMPFYFLLGAKAVFEIAGCFKLRTAFVSAVLFLVLFLSVSNYHGSRSTDGWRLESNMEYLDMVRLHRQAARYLEAKYGNEIIVSNFPMTSELKIPWYGYVTSPMRVFPVEAAPQDRDIIILWSAQSNIGSMKRLIEFSRSRMVTLRTFTRNGKTVEILRLKNPS